MEERSASTAACSKPDTALLQDRAAGAIVGAFIGDALGLGPHWYYDIDQLRAKYGEWIDGYTDPQPGWYHSGLKGGQLSQSGIILRLTVSSLIDRGGYDQGDFTARLERDLFSELDGKPMSGPGGYTSESMRKAWHSRVVEGLPWGQCACDADTTEAAERALAIAVRYALRPADLADAVARNARLTQSDGAVVAMTAAFCSVLGLLVETGGPLDATVSDTLMERTKAGQLPFFVVTSGKLAAPKPGQAAPPSAGLFSSPDALLTPGCVARAARDEGVRIEPAWKVSLVYGMPCAIYHQLPAAYYLAARFAPHGATPGDFESAVLHAINGGGQNMARAMLTGALMGAQVGLSAIPQRFIDGLEDGEVIVELAKQLARSMALEGPA